MKKEVNVIIKERREELGLTLEDVAKYVGVNNSTVSRWESGNIGNMRRDKIVKLAEILSLSPAVIMGWEVPTTFENTPEVQKKLTEITNGEVDLIMQLREMDEEARAAFIERIYEYAKANRKREKILKEIKKEA